MANNPAAPENQPLYQRVASFMVRLVARFSSTSKDASILPRGHLPQRERPLLEPGTLKGVKLAVQGQAPLFTLACSQVAPGVYAPSAGAAAAGEDVPGSDVTAFNDGSIVPLDGDHTTHWSHVATLGVRLLRLEP
ncbi:MAG: hypothetical protein QM778_34180 [Myxococcales bacterium]